MPSELRLLGSSSIHAGASGNGICRSPPEADATGAMISSTCSGNAKEVGAHHAVVSTYLCESRLLLR